MATFKITPANSVLTTGIGAHAFTNDTPDPDILVVDADAFLIATGSGARGAVLNSQQAWTVTVNGSIFSQQSEAILLGAANPGVSTITVGVDGAVGGGTSGIYAGSSANITNAGAIAGTFEGITIVDGTPEGMPAAISTHTIKNSGVISGGSFAINDVDGLSTDKVTNSGTINGTVLLAGQNDTFANTGEVYGMVDAGSGNDTLSNTKLIDGTVDLGGGDDRLTNSGTITSALFADAGNDVVTNQGAIASTVSLGDGANKLTNSGALNDVYAASGNDVLTNSGAIDMANLGEGNDIVTNTGTIDMLNVGGGNDTVSNSKSIGNFLSLGDGEDVLNNSGTIYGTVSAGGGNDKIANSKIVGFADLGEGDDTLTNNGTLGGVLGGAGSDTVTNLKSIQGTVDFSESGQSKLTNSGSIVGNIIGGFGDDVVVNSNTIKGNIDLGAGSGKDALTNNGTIYGNITGSGDYQTLVNSKLVVGSFDLLASHGATLINKGVIEGDYLASVYDDEVTNFGTIQGDVDLRGGYDKATTLTNSGTIGGDITGAYTVLTNTGTILGNIIDGGHGGTRQVTNSGTIHGDIKLSNSDGDTMTNTGTVLGRIDLGVGDDVFTGGSKAEIVRDDAGADVYNLGAGNDTYLATATHAGDEDDTVNAGTGVDTYDASAASFRVMVNLDAVDHDTPGDVAVQANSGVGPEVSDTIPGLSYHRDILTDFENVKTGNGFDIIHGSALANVIESGNGDDYIAGYGGNDVLNAGNGNDVLSGGAGKDVLTSGTGFDNFDYRATSDSGVTKATRDVITDFQDGADRIWLNAIDANSTTGTVNDAFTFIGTFAMFSGTAGELRAVWTGAGQLIEGDVNGDKVADFSIEILDPTHAIQFTAADFLL